MHTISFNTIDRRGCCRAWTCPGYSSACLWRKFRFQRRGFSKCKQPWQKLGTDLAFQGMQQGALIYLFPLLEKGWVLCQQGLLWPWCLWGMGCRFDFLGGCWHISHLREARGRSSAVTWLGQMSPMRMVRPGEDCRVPFFWALQSRSRGNIRVYVPSHRGWKVFRDALIKFERFLFWKTGV